MEKLLVTSLRRHIDAVMAVKLTGFTRTFVIEDGMALTGKPKPFATIQPRIMTGESIAAGRDSYEKEYRFQIGIFATSSSKRADFFEAMEAMFLAKEGIPVFNDPTKRIYFDITEYTPMYSDDNSNETYQHHGYFVVTARVLTDASGVGFTQ